MEPGEEAGCWELGIWGALSQVGQAGLYRAGIKGSEGRLACLLACGGEGAEGQLSEAAAWPDPSYSRGCVGTSHSLARGVFFRGSGWLGGGHLPMRMQLSWGNSLETTQVRTC